MPWPYYLGHLGHAVDIGPDGVGFLAEGPLRPGSVLALQVLEGPPSASRTRVARVVHCAPTGVGSWRVGCVVSPPFSPEEIASLRWAGHRRARPSAGRQHARERREGTLFDLPHALPRQAEALADLRQRQPALAPQPEAQPQHRRRARAQPAQRPQGLAGLLGPHQGRGRGRGAPAAPTPAPEGYLTVGVTPLGPGALRAATDAELLARYAEHGDQAAFACVVRRWERLVLHACLRVTRHRQDAEDACQLVFVTLARRAGVVGAARLYGWLCAAGRRSGLYVVRRRLAKRRQGEALVAFGPGGEHAPDVEGPPAPEPADWVPALLAALETLPPRLRETLRLVYLEGRGAVEAAPLLGLTRQAVNARVRQAVALLRCRLNGTGVRDAI
jgi:DNA-directed RNA polymerase specialized sigma24 family protein